MQGELYPYLLLKGSKSMAFFTARCDHCKFYTSQQESRILFQRTKMYQARTLDLIYLFCR